MKPAEFRFECTACGLCCKWGGYVCLYPSDLKRLAGHFGTSLQQVVDKYTKHILVEFKSEDETLFIPYLTLKNENDRCIFLEGKLCSVHESKPLHCADSPFLAEFLLDDQGWQDFSKNCEGVGIGPLISMKTISGFLQRQIKRDRRYEAELEKHDWDLGRLLGLKLEEPELIPDFGLEIDTEEYA